MDDNRSSLDDDIEFGTAGRTPSPLGGGGTTNIGGGTSGAGQGNADAQRNSSDPISDVVGTDVVGNAGVSGGMSDRDDDDVNKRSKT